MLEVAVVSFIIFLATRRPIDVAAATAALIARGISPAREPDPGMAL